VAGKLGVGSHRARAGHGRASDDQRGGFSARADGQGAARLRPAPARLKGADGSLRDRASDRGHDPAELGDARRFSSSREAVRYSGLDITVHQSDQRRAPGHLSRQGPPALRWALYEAAQSAHRKSSPDREHFLQAAERLGGNRACLAVARSCSSAATTPCASFGDEALQPA